MQFLRRDSLIVPYLALLALGGIAAHLTLEFAGMGRAAAAEVTALGTHSYLFAVGLFALATLVTWTVRFRSASSGFLDLKRRLQLAVDELPWRGTGLGFLVLTVCAELGFAAGTQIFEGMPVYGHDMLAGVVAAVLTAVANAFLRSHALRALPRIAAAIATFVAGDASLDRPHALRAVDAAIGFSSEYWPVTLFSRPPPTVSVIA